MNSKEGPDSTFLVLHEDSLLFITGNSIAVMRQHMAVWRLQQVPIQRFRYATEATSYADVCHKMGMFLLKPFSTESANWQGCSIIYL